VNFLSQVFKFLTTGSNWTGSGYTSGILQDLGNQLELSAVAVVGAVVVGVGLGAFLGHSGRGGFAVVNGANAARAVPSLALLTLLAIQPAFASFQQGGFVVAAITMWALAVPPILTNAYVGVRNVEAPVRTAAVSMGMERHQVLWRVELPLALPLILAGVRTAAVEVVATATLAAYVGVSDLGSFIFTGLNEQNGPETFSGALLVAVLALAVDQALAWAGRAVAVDRRRPRRARPGGRASPAGGVGLLPAPGGPAH
jgi:osmoprotectant transport system permease protein